MVDVEITFLIGKSENEISEEKEPNETWFSTGNFFSVILGTLQVSAI